MKKLLSVFLVVAIALSIITVVALSPSATDVEPVLYVSGDYTYTPLDSTTAQIAGYGGNDAEVEIPSVIDDYTVVSVRELAFLQIAGLESVTIPSSVKSIGDSAFFDCESLVKVTMLAADCEIFDSEYTIPATVTIYGYDNSTAQLYAEKYERSFVSLGEVPTEPPTEAPTEAETDAATQAPTNAEETEAETEAPTVAPTDAPTEAVTEAPTLPPYILGDVDGDKEVSIMDATEVQLVVAQIVILDDVKKLAADADRDGEISIMDSTQIQLFVAQVIDSL